MEHNKKVNRAGGVSIPASLRREYGIEPGEKVNVSVNDQGVIELKRIEGACIFCQANENLKQYKGRYVCNECQDAIGGL